MKKKRAIASLLPYEQYADRPVRYHLLKLANGAVERLLSIKTLKDCYHKIPESSEPLEFLRNALDVLYVQHSVEAEDLNSIPSKGPTIVVANHPFGGIDGVLLASLLCSVRKDVKFLVNYFLGGIPDLKPLFFLVDPFETKSAINRNKIALKEALRWVKDGGMLVVFPAGEVSHFSWKRRKIEDPDWDPAVARFVRMTKASVVPVYFKGHNSLVFSLAGLIHPRLRTILLPKELLKKRFKRINVKIGSAIPYKWLAAIENDKDLTAYLRFRTYMLGNAFSKFPAFFNTPMKNWKKHKNPEPIVAPADPQDLALEVEKLDQDQLMDQSGDLQVYTAYPKQIPKILYEIGRLREETFRLVGEGTGKSLDLDRFDDDNIHLFVWNAEKKEVVGAYRLAQSDEIERKYGRKGFYTYTLFKYQDRLLRQIGPGLELSRSFVRAEYQRNYAPLLLLWKGLGQFVVHHPKYKVLFGAVSITNAYNSYSRNLMAAFLKSNNFVDELSQLVRPRKPYRQKRIKGLNRKNPEFWPGDIEELSNWISGIETDGKGIPILLKQYLKLGGKLLSFNIDPSFGNVLDGLIMVDLTCTDPKVLRRYMGPEGFETFISYHLGSGSEFPLGESMPANACANPY